MVEQGLGFQRGKPSSFGRACSMDFVWLTVGRANFHDVASGPGIESLLLGFFGIEPLVLGFFSYILFLSEKKVRKYCRKIEARIGLKERFR